MDRLKHFLAGVLRTDESDLPPPSTPFRDIDGWDSLRHVSLVVGLENEFKVKLTALEIRGVVTLADVSRILKEKGVDV